MPIYPIAPELLSKEVIKHLVAYNNTIANKTEEQIGEFCKLFNSSIYGNNRNESCTFVYPAQTGSAKSLSLKVYVSLLKDESSLLVVSRVDDAIEYCKFINDNCGDNNYARCYYSVTDKNKDSEYRADIHNLKDYRCIVISHAMFKKVNQNVNLDLYKLYNDKQRDLIVIDERISFFEKYIVSKEELYNIHDYLSFRYYTRKHHNEDESVISASIQKLIELFDQIGSNTIYNKIPKYNPEDKWYISDDELIALMGEESKYPFDVVDIQHENVQFYIQDFFNIYDKLEDFIVSSIKTSFYVLSFLTQISNNNYKNTLIRKRKDLIGSIKLILQDNFIYHKSSFSESFVRVENIANKLGSSIVLDATANINMFYKLATDHGQSIDYVYAEQIRKYTNLTVHKAKGFRQGRSSLFKGLKGEALQQSINMYVAYINSVLSNSSDKLLVITHKGFKLHLQTKCNDDRVQFTHWGNHVGKNNWSDCNKVMIIGWYYLNEIEHLCTSLNAIEYIGDAFEYITSEMLYKFKVSQLADDLIQGVMRCKARQINTLDSDCSKADIYLFYSDIKEYNDVLSIFESQFKGAKIVDWTPTGYDKLIKKTKTVIKADALISYLENKESTHQTVPLGDIIKELDINKSTLSRIIKQEYFINKLQEKGYTYKNSNGRSKHFILS